MLKAVLDLSGRNFINYKHLDLEQNWRSVAVIRIWLKARNFDLSIPILVTRDEEKNTLTFFQTVSNSGRTIVLVHPNPDILHQIDTSLQNAGHKVYSFNKVEDANRQLYLFSQNKVKLDRIIIPRNLKVSYNYTYKNFLNRTFPMYSVIVVDNRDYRDKIDINLSKDEYIYSIFKKEGSHVI